MDMKSSQPSPAISGSTSQEAATLRHELYQCTRRKRQIVVDGDNYELRARTYDSFGEQAYRVRLHRV